MVLKYCSLVLLAVTLLGCAESRPEDSSLVDTLLRTRGSSVQQLHARIAAADSDLEQIVSGINAELKSDLLRIDGDVLRVDSESLRALVADGLRARIRESFAGNPALAEALERNSLAQLEARSLEAAQSSPIDASAVRALLESHRQKRGLRAGEFDLAQIISDLVFSILHEQLSAVLNDALNGVKNLLLGFYSAVTPTNDLEKVFAFVKNTLIQKAVELITVLQQNIKTIVPTTNNTESGQVARRKRQAGDAGAGDGAAGDGAAGAGGAGDGAGDGGGEVGFGLLDTLIQALQGVLSLITTPLNFVLKAIVNGLLSLLSPILGTTLVSSIMGTVNSALDLLLPTVA